MAAAVAVRAAGDHLTLDGAAHVRDLLGPLVDEQHDEVHVGVILGDGLGDVLEEDRLAGARWGDDEAALPPADRREHVHDAHGERFGAGLQDDPFVRVHGRQVVEVALGELTHDLTLDLLHAGQARPAGPLLGCLDGAGEQ